MAIVRASTWARRWSGSAASRERARRSVAPAARVVRKPRREELVREHIMAYCRSGRACRLSLSPNDFRDRGSGRAVSLVVPRGTPWPFCPEAFGRAPVSATPAARPEAAHVISFNRATPGQILAAAEREVRL